MRVDAETMAKEFYEARNPTMRWSALAWWEKLHMAVLAEREACAKVAESYEPTCDICPSGVANAIRARGNRE